MGGWREGICSGQVGGGWRGGGGVERGGPYAARRLPSAEQLHGKPSTHARSHHKTAPRVQPMPEGVLFSSAWLSFTFKSSCIRWHKHVHIHTDSEYCAVLCRTGCAGNQRIAQYWERTAVTDYSTVSVEGRSRRAEVDGTRVPSVQPC